MLKRHSGMVVNTEQIPCGYHCRLGRYETRCFVKTKQRWMVLCEQAAREQDSNKLMELTEEIIRLLDEKDIARRVMAPARASGQHESTSTL